MWEEKKKKLHAYFLHVHGDPEGSREPRSVGVDGAGVDAHHHHPARWHPMLADGATQTRPPIHPQQPPSTAIGRGWRRGAGTGAGTCRTTPSGHRPDSISIGPHPRLSNTPSHRPPSDPRPPSNPIGFFRIGRHTTRPGASGLGMTWDGWLEGLATARFGWCDYHGNSGHRTH